MVEAIIGAATTLLIATIGGIIWIVRKFGEMNRDISIRKFREMNRDISILKEIVNNRFSSFEQCLTHLEDFALYKSAAWQRGTEEPVPAVKGIELLFIEEKSNE